MRFKQLSAVLALLACAFDLHAQEVGQYPNATTPLVGNERLLADQSNTTVNITPAQLQNFILQSGGLAISVSQGGTGVTSITGLILGNGTAPFSAANAANVYSLFGANGSSTCFLSVTAGVAGCTNPAGSGTVTTTGSPTSGAIAKFSGASSITNAGLSDILGAGWTGNSGCSTGTNALLVNGSCGASGGGGFPTIGVPAVFTVTGNTTSTPTIVAAGTAGGVVYFPTATTMASTAALTANQIMLGGGASGPSALGSLGSATTLLHGNASGIPIFSAVNLTSDVINILPPGSGGSGANNTGSMLWSGAITFGGGGFTLTVPSGSPSYVMPPSGGNIGYLGCGPPRALITANYTAQLTDNGTCLFVQCAATCTMTLPANSSVAFPVGAIIDFVNLCDSTVNASLAVTTDTSFLLPTGATPSTMAICGEAIARKTKTTQWTWSGTNISRLIKDLLIPAWFEVPMRLVA